jgi:2-polyprenyl-3-methyl-5-hydroxy-6-metoxy-1,4-benzoquinol methylase
MLSGLKTAARALYNLYPIATKPGVFLKEPMPEALRKYEARGEPSLDRPGWQLVTASQMEGPIYERWCRLLRDPRIGHRKVWEWVYILEVLKQHGMLTEAKRGLGFGCGTEPLSALMASLGAEIVATDLDTETAEKQGWWTKTHQHAGGLAQLNEAGICDPDLFARRVSYRSCDMNAISGDLGGFDFVWSSCSLEHLGSLANGLDFIERSMDCLNPGGVAVHTTEFNLGTNDRTLQTSAVVAYRKKDIEGLAWKLIGDGHKIPLINFSPGDRLLDRVVDRPPYRHSHLKLLYSRHLLTSIGLFVVKPEAGSRQRAAGSLSIPSLPRG